MKMDHCSSTAVHGSTLVNLCTAFSVKNLFRGMDSTKSRKSSLPNRLLKGTTDGVSRMFEKRRTSEQLPEKIVEEINLILPLESTPENEEQVETDSTQVDEQNISNVLALPTSSMRSRMKILKDEALFGFLQSESLPLKKLETIFKYRDERPRAINIRRMWLSYIHNFRLESLHHLPFKSHDYSLVRGVARKVVLGYIPLPLGIAGPFLMMELCRGIEASAVHVPMATTEGCLVASVQRGARALFTCGIKSQVYRDFVTSSPLIEMPTSVRAMQLYMWLEQRKHVKIIRKKFESVDPLLKFGKVSCKPAGKLLYIRFHLSTGDSADLKMIADGTKIVLKVIKRAFPDLNIVSPSGNFGSDGRKPSALNWVEGRGKSVIAEAVVPEESVLKILKTRATDLEYLNRAKNIIGSGLAGAIGGSNAHAANIVTAIFLATGQDISNIVGSSSCITQMEATPNGDLHISVTMPSLDVATHGGQTNLSHHASCLKIMGLHGPHPLKPGENARMLARVICAAVMAGELSLMAALSANHLVSSHMRLNRSSISLPGLYGIAGVESESESGDERERGPPKSI